jgi:hypothetical protein
VQGERDIKRNKPELLPEFKERFKRGFEPRQKMLVIPFLEEHIKFFGDTTPEHGPHNEGITGILSLKNDLGLYVEAIDRLLNRFTRDRPMARLTLGMRVAATLRQHGRKVNKYRDGIYVTCLEHILSAVGGRLGEPQHVARDSLHLEKTWEEEREK